MTTNPFTPQDAERLRKAHRKATESTSAAHAAVNFETLKSEFLKAGPAMLDLIDALVKLAQAANELQDVGGFDGSGQAMQLNRQLRALRTGPHAEWLKQGR